MTLEARILWGTTVLHVAHLTPPRSLCVGELASEYSIPREVLGSARLHVVVLRRGEMVLVIPAGARGHVDAPGREREFLEDLVSSGQARSSCDCPGAHETDLPTGATARVELAGSSVVFQVALVHAGKRLRGGGLSELEPTDFLYTASSFLLHVGLLAIFAFFMPKMGADDDAAIDRDNVLAMKKLLNAAAAREERTLDVLEPGPSRVDAAGASVAAARGPAGSMGTMRATRTGRYGIEGPRDTPDPYLARRLALADAAQFGVVELLGSIARSLPRAPAAEWGRDTPSGRDDATALGAMFGDGIDDAVGAAGLDRTGLEPGGGGHAETIGLQDMGVLDRGIGGSDDGIRAGRSPRQGTHTPTAPRVRDEVTTVSGHLRPEVIQRIVRQNFGRFRGCYESGLRANPSLQGRVVVKFTIDRSGAVGLSTDAGGDLADRAVTQCVVRAFADLSFPPPDGGMVTVVYPIAFNPM